MLARLADYVARNAVVVIVAWIVVVAAVHLAAPPWDRITHDGDFAYLPPHCPSVVGERWMTEAFPRQRGRSQVVVAIVRADGPMTNDDIQVAYDVARRVRNLFAASRLAEARRLAPQMLAAPSDESTDDEHAGESHYARSLDQAHEALVDALELDQKLVEYWDQRVAARSEVAPLRPPRLAEIYHNLALLESLRGNPDQAAAYRAVSVELSPGLRDAGDQVLPLGAETLPLVDNWTWRESYFGDKLISRDKSVRLVLLQLTNEFMAVDNIRIVEQIESAIAPAYEQIEQRTVPGLSIVLSGSAAVGADLLRSAAASIRHTELFTVLLVVLILALVYRSPLLVAVPILTIVMSLVLATGLVALLTGLSGVPGFGWWSLKVFSTTKIFIVVILFGAGTDYCLFLVARYREELLEGLTHERAVAAAVVHVGDALAASALTTVVGLSMMFFADFGKYRHSGPVIGLCLAVTLVTCVTFTPALMRLLGSWLFWPAKITARSHAAPGSPPTRLAGSPPNRRVWHLLAQWITRRPGLILIGSVLLLLPAAARGVWTGSEVTYDILSGLPAGCPSRHGAELLSRHFPVGESGPVSVLVLHEQGQFETPDGRDRIRQLSAELHLPGVRTVRSAEDPLGDFEPGEKPGILSDRGRALRILRAHPRTRAIFVAESPSLAGQVARFELILDRDPFSRAAIEVVDGVQRHLEQLTRDPSSFWYQAQFAMTGTTAAIRDLRQVTRRDNVIIQCLVVLAVLAVLLFILRRPVVCAYMMLSVLFSYFVTLGLVTLFFSVSYGESYHGLDWKVPLFLFVILVAIGQDYNVYLATRVFEEQARIGPFAGLRRAVVQTGGIITSCGIIMAGTFLSMTSAAWSSILPESVAHLVQPAFGPTRGVVELGFALALGVLLDTFVVRPILLPSFLALICRRAARRGRVLRK